MTIEIALKNSYGRLSNREPFLIATDTPVVLAFHSDYALKDTMVKFISDTGRTCSFRLANLSEIEVPQAFVHAGTVTVEVALIVKEQVVKRWSVEPIVLMEDTTGFSLHPEFEDIVARLAAVETAVKVHGESIAAVETASAEAAKNISDLWAAVEQ